MEHYNKAEAAFELEEIAIQRSLNQFAGIQLAKTTEYSSSLNDCEPVRGGEPVAWRLSCRDVDTGLLEEVVASVQGIIVKHDLPPFEQKINAGSPNIRYLKQSVTLTGFNTPTFASAIAEVTRLHTLFIRAVGAKNLERCTIVGQQDGCNTLEMGTRYLTPVREAPNAQDTLINPQIDPHGFLAQAKGAQYIHSEDNQVLYLERTGRKGAYKFIPANPIIFQNGDIVEAQISIIAVPLRDKRFKMMSMLRSLTLFDGSFTQRAAAASQLMTLTVPVASAPPLMLKRKVGYEIEVMAETRFKLSKMSIDAVDKVQDEEDVREVSMIANPDAVDSLD